MVERVCEFVCVSVTETETDGETWMFGEKRMRLKREKQSVGSQTAR